MIRSPARSTPRMVSIASSSMRRNSFPGSQNLTDKSVAPRDDGLDGLHHAFLVEAVKRLQVLLVSDYLVELGPQPDALEGRVAWLHLVQHLGAGTAQPALHAVLFQREDELGLP